MDSQQRQEKPELQTEPTGCMPLILRLTWMAFGNIALFLCAGLVAKRTAPVVMDIAFFAIAIGLIVVRYLDITRFKGQTAEEKPATLARWRQYSVLLAIISFVLWAFARFVASRGWM